MCISHNPIQIKLISLPSKPLKSLKKFNYICTQFSFQKVLQSKTYLSLITKKIFYNFKIKINLKVKIYIDMSK